VRLQAPPSNCIWTRDLGEFDCPIAHGEGRYAHDDPSGLAAVGQVALRYAGTNPNGSIDAIAGVCDASGVVLGLMPHPENHVLPRQHPRYSRGTAGGLGLTLFEQGVRYAKER
jgi:phosphoribosylformylglycinamidine synthase